MKRQENDRTPKLQKLGFAGVLATRHLSPSLRICSHRVTLNTANCWSATPQKYLRYKRDVTDPARLDEIGGMIRRLRAALKQRDPKEIESRAEELDAKLHELTPVTWESHWRENVEVILVAIVVAVGIRSYFLQPFKIPTGSMQPTLNGIIGRPMDAAPPNFLQQVTEFVLRGRNYINVVSQEDDQVLQIEQKKFLFFFTWSRIICRQQHFLVYCPPDQLRGDFKVLPGSRYRRGEVIARGAVDTGDQVFVDKFSYNFVKPHRGDVFVFRTNNIPMIPEDPETGAPFYIKRLAGLPGDNLRIQSPSLYVNGGIAAGLWFSTSHEREERLSRLRPRPAVFVRSDENVSGAGAQLLRDGR